jgi:DNA-binding response OmpR family regulator
MMPNDVRILIRVLLVEDDAELCALLVHALERDRHEVLVVRSGAELVRAVEVPAGGGRLVDVVVVDAPRPGRDGLVDVAKLRAGGRTMPVVLITAVDDADIREDARRLGVAATLQKPFDLAELRSTVRKVACAA